MCISEWPSKPSGILFFRFYAPIHHYVSYFLILLSFLLNFSILVVLSQKQMRRLGVNVMMMSIAYCDFFCSTFAGILLILEQLSEGWENRKSSEPNELIPDLQKTRIPKLCSFSSMTTWLSDSTHRQFSSELQWLSVGSCRFRFPTRTGYLFHHFA